MERHITNLEDALIELKYAHWLYARSNGTFVSYDGVPISKEIVEELKKMGQIRLANGDDKTGALYEAHPFTGKGGGASHYHLHD